jgi:hypothetical protein
MLTLLLHADGQTQRAKFVTDVKQTDKETRFETRSNPFSAPTMKSNPFHPISIPVIVVLHVARSNSSEFCAASDIMSVAMHRCYESFIIP